MSALEEVLSKDNWLLDIDTDWESGIEEHTWSWESLDHPPLEEARKELADLRNDLKSFESLTPGGSEFADDPKAVYTWLKDRQDSFIKVVLERNALRQRTEWQPIDTCPEKTDVLLLLPSSSGLHVEQAEREGFQYFSLYGNSREFRSPICWMYIPELP